MRALAPTLVFVLLLSGCGKPASATPTAAPLKPYQGSWQFDLEETIALWESQGVAASQIEYDRARHGTLPVHADMRIDGNVAVLPGTPVEGEYAFFALHQRDERVCGKAWHHEDRLDNGDMSKCYVRLELKGPQLHLSVRMQDGPPRLNDPELTNMPPTAGSEATCGADAAANPPWSAWRTYVFDSSSGMEPSDAR